MAPTMKLIARIENSNSADVSIKDVRALAKSQDPEAIDALAGLLDDDGPVGREAARALTRFGRIAEPTLRRCLASHDETVVANARRLLAALGETTAPELTVAEVVAVVHGAHDAPRAPKETSGEVELPPPVVVVNDNAEREAADLATLTHEDLVEAVEGTLLRRGIARQDLGDAVANVQVKTLEFLRTRDAPLDLEGWKKLCNKIADAHGLDVLRKKYRRARYDVELCEEPDEYADPHVEKLWEPVDEARLMGIVVEHLRAAKIPEVSFAILDGEAADTPHIELAAELGMTRWAVERHLAAMQRELRKRVEANGMRELIPAMQRKRE